MTGDMKQIPKIIGLSGTNGSGKDTAGELLAQKHNYLFISVSDLLRDEARKRGQPVERTVLRTISAEWRRTYGLGVLVDRAMQAFEATNGQYAGVVICPMRNPAEAEHLKAIGGVLLWIDADPRVRYDRIQAGAQARGRAGEDRKTFEEFLAEEHDEMHGTGDAAVLNMAGVKALADRTVLNNGSDKQVLVHDIETALGAAQPADN